ncbi:MAG: S-adenosylhomocysteine deaminase, partial [Deltaproteobacteria bacterium]
MVKEVDILIKNGTVLTMDAHQTLIEKGFLCVRGDTISTVAEGEPHEFRATRTIDAKGGLILPGLINGHTHAAMTLF